MKPTTRAQVIALLVLCLVALVTACRQNPESSNAGTGSQAPPTAEDAVAEEDTEASEATNDSPPAAGACDIITVEEIQNITGKIYESTSSQANFPNIRHCEYRGQQDVVSWLIATGTTATDRISLTKQLPHTPITGFQDEAIWEPVEGVLSVLSNGRLAEIRISKTHGDEPTRIEQAKALALLLFSR